MPRIIISGASSVLFAGSEPPAPRFTARREPQPPASSGQLFLPAQLHAVRCTVAPSPPPPRRLGSVSANRSVLSPSPHRSPPGLLVVLARSLLFSTTHHQNITACDGGCLTQARSPPCPAAYTRRRPRNALPPTSRPSHRAAALLAAIRESDLRTQLHAQE